LPPYWGGPAKLAQVNRLGGDTSGAAEFIGFALATPPQTVLHPVDFGVETGNLEVAIVPFALFVMRVEHGVRVIGHCGVELTPGPSKDQGGRRRDDQRAHHAAGHFYRLGQIIRLSLRLEGSVVIEISAHFRQSEFGLITICVFCRSEAE
jgi:hypothetical protein